MSNRGDYGRRFFKICLLALIPVAWSSGVFGLCGGVAYRLLSGGPTDPHTRYRQLADTELPPSANIIAHEDEDRCWNGDGVFTIVFELDDVDLNALLQSAPFGGPWDAGPVSTVIKNHFFENDFKRKAPLNASNVIYTAQNRGPKDMPWHNGRIFIVDRGARRVWFGEWDY